MFFRLLLRSVRPLVDISIPMLCKGTSSCDNARLMRDCFFFFKGITFRLVLCHLNNACILVATLFFLLLVFNDNGDALYDASHSLDALNVDSLSEEFGGDDIYNRKIFY